MAVIPEDVEHTVDMSVAADPARVGRDEPQLASLTRDVGVFVELLDKHDQVIQRARFETLPVTIGNHYRCDHILDTDEAAVQSVAIVRDEANRLRVRAAKPFWAPGGSTTEWIVDPERAFMVAGARIRVRTRDYVPQYRRTSTDVILRLSGWTVLFALAGAVGLASFQAWLIDVEGLRTSQYVTAAFAVIGMLSLWAGVWAIVSKLTGKSTHFLAHLSLAAIGMIVSVILEFGFDSLTYAFDLKTLWQYGTIVLWALLGVLVWAHARLIVRTRAVSAWIAAFVVAGSVLAIEWTSSFNARSSFAQSATLNEVRPPSWRIASGVSLDDFQNSTARLEAATEALKSEKPEGIDTAQYGE
jgi:hypothetical protein